MCEFCNKYHSQKGMTFGREIKINKCALDTDLKDCQVHSGYEGKPSIIIWNDGGIAKGYFDITFCPICGRKLVEE